MNQENFDETLAGLTQRRKEVLEKVFAGDTNDAIAKSLSVSPATVRKHIEEICDIFSIPKGSLRERPSRRNQLIALFATYKPELLSGAIPELLRQSESVGKKTKFRNSDCVRTKHAIAPFTTEDVEVLVQKVRSDLDKTLQKECATLYTFNLLYTPMRGNLSKLYVQTQINKSQGFGSGEFSQERQLWQEVVLRNSKLMVLGKPGAGKTTLLQYIAIRCNEVEFQPKPVPVFVSLKSLTENIKRENEIDLLVYIRKKYCRSRISEQELETLLTHGRLIFLLDGLDEVTEDKVRAVVSKIHNLVNEYEENRFIVTCRKEYDSYKSKQFCNFAFCKVADFEQAQIEEFIKNWFDESTENTQPLQPSQATQLIEKLKLPENQRIRELADTPLLLHLICLIFQEKEDLPSRRVDLYKECINLLLEKWNRFNDRSKIDAPDIDLVELRKALRQIAAITFEQGKSYFEQGKIRQFIKNHPRTLSDIELLSGILVKKSWQIYAFSHQTFQEYLTAEALSTSQIGWRKGLTHIAEPRWREVLFLMLEMYPNTDDFVSNLRQSFLDFKTDYDHWYDDCHSNDNDSYWKYPSMSDSDLEQFLVKVNQKSYSVSNRHQYKNAAIRAFYFSCFVIVTNFSLGRSDIFDGSSWVYSDGVKQEDLLFKLACDIDDKFIQSIESVNTSIGDIELDYRLIITFILASELNLFHESEDTSTLELTFELKEKISFILYIVANHYYKIEQLHVWVSENNQKAGFLDLSYELVQFLRKLRNELSPYLEDYKLVLDWWSDYGSSWYQEFRKLMIEQRNIGFSKNLYYFTDHAVLEQYYEANKILVDCLNRSVISNEVRSIIEENIFLSVTF